MNRSALLAAFAFSLAFAVAAPPPPEPPPFVLPKPPPAQVASSEGMPPLPYPAVPQKRQEKKNPPQPPTLLTKIKSDDLEDWARTPNDLKGLLEWLSTEMSVHFTSNVKSFSEITPNPQGNPLLYRSGYKAFTLTDADAAKLREYCINGGTIVFNSLVGNPDAYASAKAAAAKIFPDRPVYRLRNDHPVFKSFYNIGKVQYRERMKRDGVIVDDYAFLEGVDLDNRSAIIISRWDFSLGWEANAHESWGYADVDSRKLGANIVAYVTAMRDAGRSVGKSVQLADADTKKAGKFRVGQIKHNGPWKTRSAAFPMLLNALNKETGAAVSFDLRDVSLTDGSLFEMPFVYLTGTTDFSFTEDERGALRKYLSQGGVMFVEAGEGRVSFDQSFRAEIAKVLPGKPLTALPANHELFRQPKGVEAVRARPALAAKKGGQLDVPPELFGVEINGTLGVIYSPNDLSAGWERAIAPYAAGYEPKDAMAIGLNVLYYGVAH
jgi:hypothetical protein